MGNLVIGIDDNLHDKLRKYAFEKKITHKMMVVSLLEWFLKNVGEVEKHNALGLQNKTNINRRKRNYLDVSGGRLDV